MGRLSLARDLGFSRLEVESNYFDCGFYEKSSRSFSCFTFSYSCLQVDFEHIRGF